MSLSSPTKRRGEVWNTNTCNTGAAPNSTVQEKVRCKWVHPHDWEVKQSMASRRGDPNIARQLKT
jgi:hypothetical protein